MSVMGRGMRQCGRCSGPDGGRFELGGVGCSRMCWAIVGSVVRRGAYVVWCGQQVGMRRIGRQGRGEGKARQESQVGEVSREGERQR